MGFCLACLGSAPVLVGKNLSLAVETSLLQLHFITKAISWQDEAPTRSLNGVQVDTWFQFVFARFGSVHYPELH